MAKGLSEDQIKWILSLDVSQAEKGTQQLAKQNRELTDRNKDLKKSMQQLEAQGKKNAENYKRLSDEYQKNSKQLSSNRQMMKALERQMGVNNLTMKQLKRRAQDLQNQLDSTSQSLHPDEWNKLNSELLETRSQMDNLKNSGKHVQSEFEKAIQSSGKWATLIGNIWTKIAEKGWNVLIRMKDIALEGVEMAASADGITRAFRQMDDGTMLNSLRNATKGTVNDLDLMKAAVQAKDFRIPLEDLGKYLQFAQLKAQQTGQSVDYMTQSIVTGLGRKSVMILDNLGLSAAEINEEVAKTGDFMSAVATIVDKQLAVAGDNYVSAADRAMQRTVNFQNAQRELGEVLLPLKERWDDVYGEMEISTMELIGWIVKHRSSLGILVTAITSYIATQKIATIWNTKHASSTIASVASEKLQTLQVILSRKAFLAKIIVMDLYKGRCNLATAATEMFNLVLKASPLGLVTTLLTTAAAAFVVFHKKTSDAVSISEQATKNTQKEVRELTSLKKILNNSSLEYDERKAALDRIQEIVPDYHASLTQEGKLINNNSDALDKYVQKLKVSEMMKIASQKLADVKEKRSVFEENNKSGIDKYVGAKMAYNEMDAMGNRKYDSLEAAAANIGMSPTAFRAIDKQIQALNNEVDQYEDLMDEYTKELIKIDQNITNSSGELSDTEKKKLMEESSLLIKLQKEKQIVQDTWKEDTEENIELKNKELERLDNEIKKYQELGKTKKESKTKDEESPLIKEAQKDYQQELSAQQQAYQQDLNNYRILLQQKKITKEQYAVFEATSKTKNADALLEIEDNYYVALLGLSARGEKIKEETITQAAKKVQDAEQAAFDARLSAEQTFQDNLQAMRDMIQAPEQKPEDKLKAQYDLQLTMLESFYQASLEYAKKHGQDEAEVTAIYDEAKLSLDEKYHKDKENLIKDSNARIKGIEGNELSQYVADIFNTIADLQDIFDNFSDPDFWEKFGDNVMESMGKLASAITGGLSSAFNTFQKIEMDNVEAKYNAEIEAAQGNSEEIERLEQEKAQKKLDIEKKYADIQFAIKASEIIANTAVAIMMCLRQLGPIAGPIAAGLIGATGAIQLAAANAERKKVKSMTLSGSSSSSKETGTRVATGREEGGKIDIVRAQDGKFFPDADYDPDKRGFIDSPTVIVGEGPAGKSKEWVASNAAVENPTIAPLLQLLDAHQQAGDISTIDLNQIMRQRMAAGYVSGGSISTPISTSATVPAGNTTNPYTGESVVMAELLALLSFLKENGIPAYVVLSELEKKQNLRDRARQIGSKS